MKVNKDFILRDMGSKCVAVPIGKTYETFRGFIKMNESAKFICEALAVGKTEDEVVAEMTDRYGISMEHAATSYQKAVVKMMEAGMLEE
ncbi:MAG: PqqD family protein [Clostridiales bacterium]|nr:PqqD family protein [Clostridiales bacterium]